MKKISLCIILAVLVLSGCRDIFEENIEKDSVFVEFPENKKHLFTKEVTFVWREVEGADDYVISIVTPQFTDITEYIMRDTVISGTSFTYTFEDWGQYEWSITARNGGFESHTTTQLFYIDSASVIEIDSIAPGAPTLDSAVVDTTSVILYWSRDITATDIAFDSVIIATDAAFSSLFALETSTIESFQMTALDTNTTYYWKVKSVDNNNNQGVYSTAQSFTTN